MEAQYGYPTTEIAKQETEDFKEGVQYEKHKSLPKKSPLTVSFVTQVKTCVTRQYQILWGDKATFIIKQASTLAQALIAGSLFYNSTGDSTGLFIKSGALFLALLFNSLLAMSEVTDSFSGRPVLAKHKAFALYHPAAFCIAQIAADIPVLLIQVSHFSIVLYFMVSLKQDAGSFFTFWALIFATTMCMTALFRSIGAGFSTFDSASKVSGFMIAALVMYSGYMIPKPQMHDWFVW
jgi:ABC-type multidrug transport system permease subunit